MPAGMAQPRVRLDRLECRLFAHLRGTVMALIVHKYGGTSVGSTERIKNVARRVAKWKAAGHDVVVVPSAMSGETNRLIALAKEIQPQPDPRELDVVASTGEQVTVGLLAMALTELGVKAKSYTGAQVKVLTDSAFTKARIQSDRRAQPARGPGQWRGPGGGRLPGHGCRRATSPRWAAADPTPRRSRWRLRSRPTSASSSPTWTASTPPTRASSPRRGGCTPSPSRRCSRWRASAPRCCSCARSSSPASTKCGCACCRA